MIEMENPYFSECCTAPVADFGTDVHKCQGCGAEIKPGSKHTRRVMRANRVPEHTDPRPPSEFLPGLCIVEPVGPEPAKTTGGVVTSGQLLCFGIVIRDTRNRWERRVQPFPSKGTMIIYSEDHNPESEWHCFEAHHSEFQESRKGSNIIDRLQDMQEGGFSCNGRISKGTRFDILKCYDYQCQLCGRTAHEDGVKLHVDHKVPKAKGGTNDPDNLWVLCKDCNLGKGTKSL